MTKLSVAEQASSDDQLLAELFGSIESDEVVIDMSGEEVPDGLEVVETTSAIDEDEILADVISDIDLQNAKAELYATQEPSKLQDATPPETVDVIAKGKKDKKEKKEKKMKVPKELKAPKVPHATSITHLPGDLLKLKLGEKVGDYLTFDIKDAELSVDEILAKQNAFIARMNDRDAIADKVRDKIIMLLVWMTTGGKLNEVLTRSFRLLAKDGKLTSGDNGNLQLYLMEKPYSKGTARSQASQIFMLMPELGLTIKGKGCMVANPNSALLPIINKMLRL